MKRKKFSIEQIVAVLKQANLGLPVADLIRQIGISEQTFYRWKKQYAGLESDQVREFQATVRRERPAEQARGRVEPRQGCLAGCSIKKVPRPALKKEVVAYVTDCHGYSERRACSLTGQHRSTQRKPRTRDPRLAVRQRMHEIVQTRIRYGYRRVHIMLKRDGLAIGRNSVYRLYREEGLALRSKRPRRRKMVVHREGRCRPTRPNEAWSLDFVHDQLSTGQKLRALTIVDIFSRESLAIEVGQRLRGRTCRRGSQPTGAPARRATVSVCRQWRRVHRPLGRSLGLSPRDTDRLLATRQTNGQMPSSRPSTGRFVTNA